MSQQLRKQSHLRGIQPKYQDYHHVKYTDEAITAAAELSNRYIQDRFLPDKAIDLLDESGSKMNLTLNLSILRTSINVWLKLRILKLRLLVTKTLKSCLFPWPNC